LCQRCGTSPKTSTPLPAFPYEAGLSGAGEPTGQALLWRAVWQTGAGGALDGVAALVALGLTGFTAEVIDVSLPTDNGCRRPLASRCEC
jgi:hypothetical protein